MGSLSCLDKKAGDIRIQWDRAKVSEVEMAKKFFEQKVGEGFIGYRMNKQGDKGDQIRDFDVEAERVIMTRPFANRWGYEITEYGFDLKHLPLILKRAIRLSA